jgi:hypothetical protein
MIGWIKERCKLQGKKLCAFVVDSNGLNHKVMKRNYLESWVLNLCFIKVDGVWEYAAGIAVVAC